MGPEKIVLILLVLLLLFGAKRIPEIAGSLGKGIREFKGSLDEIGKPVHDSIREAGEAARSAPRDSAPRDAREAPLPLAPAEDDVTREPKRLI